jgi:hypothetical protein
VQEDLDQEKQNLSQNIAYIYASVYIIIYLSVDHRLSRMHDNQQSIGRDRVELGQEDIRKRPIHIQGKYRSKGNERGE